jgi:hypothetical protein
VKNKIKHVQIKQPAALSSQPGQSIPRGRLYLRGDIIAFCPYGNTH